MSMIPPNAKLEVTRDGRIFYRGEDLAGVPVEPDAAIAHVAALRQRGMIGDIDSQRVLAAAAAAKPQSGQVDASDAPAPRRAASARGADRVQRDEVLRAARQTLGEVGRSREALAEAHRNLVEGAAPLLGRRATPAATETASATTAAPAQPATRSATQVADEADPFASPANAATSATAKREVLHIIDVPETRTIKDLKDQKAGTKWLASQASKLMHAKTHPSTRPILPAALIGPRGVGRKLAVEIYARMLFDNGFISQPRVHVIDLRRIIESGADLHAVVRHATCGVVLIENAEILDRHEHHAELNIIEALAVAEGEPVLMLSGAPSLRGTLDADYRTRDTLRTQIVFTAVGADTLTTMFVDMARREFGLSVDADAERAAKGRLRSWTNAGGEEVAALLEEARGRLSERLFPEGEAPEVPHSAEALVTLTGAEVAPATFYDKDGKLPALERLKTERSTQKSLIAWAESYAKRVVENQRSQAMGEPVSDANNNVLLMGDKGTGKTTALEFINDLLYELGERNGKLTYVTASELIGANDAESAERVKDFVDRARFGVGAIDEFHILGKTREGQGVIRALVPHLLNESGTTTFIPCGYPGPVLDCLDPEIDEGTDRRFTEVNRVTLDVPTRDELRFMLEQGIVKRRYTATPEVIDAAMRVIDVLKGRAGFGNAGAIRDLINAAITRLANRERTPETMRAFIAEDFGEQPDTIENVVKGLDKFVGFEHLQETLLKIGATVEDQRAKKKPVRDGFKPFGRIIGVDGSGRKTFADAVTKVYKAFSLTSVDVPTMTDVTSLKGDVVGAAVTLTNKELRRVASDGGHWVLYNLGGIVRNPDQYALDIISTLKSGLREHQDNIAVSLVGTEAEVTAFLKMDPALAALFNRRYDLHAMDAEASGKVLAKMIAAFDLRFHDEAKAILAEAMEYLIAQPNWQNGLDLEPLSQAVRDEHLSVRRGAQYAEWDRDTVSSEALINALNFVISGKGGSPWEARPAKLATHLAKTPAATKRTKRDAA